MEPRSTSFGDPGYFASPSRDEALARLHYIVEQRRPCGLLVGPAGTGKSLLCAVLRKSLRSAGRGHVATIDLRALSGNELPASLADAWNLGPVPGSIDRIWAEVRDHVRGLALCRAQAVLIVDHLSEADDAQRAFAKLSALADRAAGALTVLYTARSIDCCPAVAAAAEMSDLRIELQPFDALETSRYASNRLIAEGRPSAPLDPETLLSIYRRTGGVAREINRVCELLLLAGVHKSKTAASPQLIDDIAAELTPMVVETTTVLV